MVGIMVLLISLLVPVFNSLTRSKGITSIVDNVSQVIDLTRTEALARNTYTWLGYYNATVSNTSQLWLVAVRSIDGTPTLTAANTRVVGKVQKFDSVLLTDITSLTTNVKGKLTAATIFTTNTKLLAYDSDAKITPALSVQVNGTATNFDHFATFTPQGESILTTSPSTSTPPTPFTSQWLIGLRKTVGTTVVASDTDSAALIIYGGTGQIRQFRP